MNKPYKSQFTKKDLKEDWKFSNPNISSSTDMDVSEEDVDPEEATKLELHDPNVKLIFQKLIRYAKSNGVPSMRATQLVDEILELFFYMLEGKFNPREKMIFLKSLALLKQRMRR
jgi:hypothetical protein